MSLPVVIVGAGPAGLVCARRLHRSGRSVLVLDSDDRPGGRLKTDPLDGYLLDRGFQVYFTAYPHANREIHLESLNLRTFEPGAKFLHNGKWETVHREDVIQTALSPYLPWTDKLRILSFNSEIGPMEEADVWAMEDVAAEKLLARQGFSEKFFQRFARPFFGGVFLDRSLSISSRMFCHVWRMLQVGEIGVPAQGMEAIPQQLAQALPEGAFRGGVRVTELVRDGDQVVGVRTDEGETLAAAHVVLACGPADAARLSGKPIPSGGKPSTCVYFEAAEPPVTEPFLLLNATGLGRVNEVVPVSVVAPETSSTGKHLVSATLLEDAPEDDRTLAKAVRYELEGWFPGQNVRGWRPLRVIRIPQAQMAMPPGFQAHLPSAVSGIPGLTYAGEYTTYGSIDGAVKSGVSASRAVLEAPVPVHA